MTYYLIQCTKCYHLFSGAVMFKTKGVCPDCNGTLERIELIDEVEE